MLHWVVVEQNNKKYLLEMPHRLYYEFSVRSCIKSQELMADIKRVQAENKGNHSGELEALLYEQRLSMINVPIYAALSLEAYINYYASRYGMPFQKDIDRLSTVKKWNIYSNWKTKKTIEKDALDKIKEIFDLRDQIVHSKPELVEHGTEEPPKGKSVQAKIEVIDKSKLIYDLNCIYEAIFKIDSDENSDHKKEPWLYELRKKS